MDGRIVARDPVALQVFAQALGVPWNSETVEKIQLLEGPWMVKVDAEYDAALKDAKKPKR